MGIFRTSSQETASQLTLRELLRGGEGEEPGARVVGAAALKMIFQEHPSAETALLPI